MDIFNDLTKWKKYRAGLDRGTIGFVPTMGALHEGHGALLKAARECDLVVLSIYVNETQFNNPEDLKKYPRTLEQDLKLAREHGVGAVLLPDYRQIYPDNYQYRVSESTLSQQLCGEHRPGHFDGVLTVVLKLLNLVRPAKAYFGEKDYQQLQLIKGMVDALFINTEIIGCPTVRETDGLALSSRNVRLGQEGRRLAQDFPRLLRLEESDASVARKLADKGFTVDYVTTIAGRRFAAVTIDGVRLIDNVENPF